MLCPMSLLSIVKSSTWAHTWIWGAQSPDCKEVLVNRYKMWRRERSNSFQPFPSIHSWPDRPHALYPNRLIVGSFKVRVETAEDNRDSGHFLWCLFPQPNTSSYNFFSWSKSHNLKGSAETDKMPQSWSGANWFLLNPMLKVPIVIQEHFQCEDLQGYSILFFFFGVEIDFN